MNVGLQAPWNFIVLAIEIFLFVYFLIVNAYYLSTGIVALLRLPWYVKLHLADPLQRSHSTLDQPVSMLVPAYNEEAIIVDSLRSMLSLDYVNYEVIVINDGSTDNTLARLNEVFALEPYDGVYRTVLPTERVHTIYQSTTNPELKVIDKANGGKGDAINAGINLARFPLVFSADADSYYHRSTLQWMTEAFEKDRRTVAVGGGIAVGNDSVPTSAKTEFEPALPGRPIMRFQVLEYLRAFLSTRMGFAPFNGLGIVSGACGLWRRDLLIEVGGFRTDTIWEDMEMTLRMHNYCIQTGRPYRISFTPYPVCWTNVPDSIGALYRQRKGWHRHLCECVLIHRKLLFGKGGFFSWVTMPYFVFFEWLAPLVVLFGLLFGACGVIFNFLDWNSQLWLLALVFVLSLLCSFVAILLDELSYTAYRLRDAWRLLVAALLENFGYRQFVTFANLMGFFAWFFHRPAGGKSNHPGPLVKAYAAKPSA